MQIARPRGAHVIATVRGDADEARRRLGAEEAYGTKAVEVIEALRASHPAGVDASEVRIRLCHDRIAHASVVLKAHG